MESNHLLPIWLTSCGALITKCDSDHHSLSRDVLTYKLTGIKNLMVSQVKWVAWSRTKMRRGFANCLTIKRTPVEEAVSRAVDLVDISIPMSNTVATDVFDLIGLRSVNRLRRAFRLATRRGSGLSNYAGWCYMHITRGG